MDRLFFCYWNDYVVIVIGFSRSAGSGMGGSGVPVVADWRRAPPIYPTSGPKTLLLPPTILSSHLPTLQNHPLDPTFFHFSPLGVRSNSSNRYLQKDNSYAIYRIRRGSGVEKPDRIEVSIMRDRVTSIEIVANQDEKTYTVGETIDNL